MHPSRRFFVVVTVPFIADDAMLEHSARKHHLLWTPMSHFYAGGGGTNQLRLSISVVTPEQIERGLDRLLALVEEQSDQLTG